MSAPQDTQRPGPTRGSVSKNRPPKTGRRRALDALTFRVAGGVVAGAMAEHQHSPGASTASPAVNAGSNGMVGLGFFSAMRDGTPVARLLENQPPSNWVVLGETAGPDSGDRQSVASVWAEVQPGPVSALVVWASLAAPLCLIASTVVVQAP